MSNQERLIDPRGVVSDAAVAQQVKRMREEDDAWKACAPPVLELEEIDFLRAELEATKQWLQRERGKRIAAELSLDKARTEHDLEMLNAREKYTALANDYRRALSERDDAVDKVERERVQRDRFWRAELARLRGQIAEDAEIK